MLRFYFYTFISTYSSHIFFNELENGGILMKWEFYFESFHFAPLFNFYKCFRCFGCWQLRQLNLAISSRLIAWLIEWSQAVNKIKLKLIAHILHLLTHWINDLLELYLLVCFIIINKFVVTVLCCSLGVATKHCIQITGSYFGSFYGSVVVAIFIGV